MKPTVLDRLLAISSLFEHDMQRAFEGTSLSESRVHVLWVLQHIGPSTQQALAAALEITPRSISFLVDALEETGYVTREPHPEDRRSVLVSLTPAATEMMIRMQGDHARLGEALLGAVDQSDRPAFLRGIDAVLLTLTDLVKSERVDYPEVEPVPAEDAAER